jgi:biopolymer transport protein ExbD
MGASFGGDNDEPIAGINITPFVDIILVVLIIFMVTAPMILKPSINVNLPDAASGEKSTPGKLQISISKAGEIFLNGEASTMDGIKTFATQLATESADSQAVIAADKDVSHGTVVSLIDAVKSAGIKKFAISIEQGAGK